MGLEVVASPLLVARESWLMSVFHFFYGGPLSQWYRSVFKVNHITYNCCEQYMMAQKAKLFNDREALACIMASKEPREQKAIGKTVRGFEQAVWVGLREKIDPVPDESLNTWTKGTNG